jgi:hypothetical protein
MGHYAPSAQKGTVVAYDDEGTRVRIPDAPTRP